MKIRSGFGLMSVEDSDEEDPGPLGAPLVGHLWWIVDLGCVKWWPTSTPMIDGSNPGVSNVDFNAPNRLWVLDLLIARGRGLRGWHEKDHLRQGRVATWQNDTLLRRRGTGAGALIGNESQRQWMVNDG